MGMTDHREAKRELRTWIRRRKSEQEGSLLAVQSLRICERLASHPRVQAAHVVLAYHSLPDEVDTHQWLDTLTDQGKTVVLPQVTGPDTMVLRRYEGRNSLQVGSFGIMEPTGSLYDDYASIDVCIIPGMAFDQEGHRLGRGKGYYDRLLPLLPQAYKIGICHPFQMVENVPHEEHDIKMDEVITGQ